MRYEKPKLSKLNLQLPPVTVNFAQPASQTGSLIGKKNMNYYVENLFSNKIN
jgi:hypothetical protein